MGGAPGRGRDDDARCRSTYFAAHSHSYETPGGFLNGLPRAGGKFRPERVCGGGVITSMEKLVEERRQAHQARAPERGWLHLSLRGLLLRLPGPRPGRLAGARGVGA